MSTTTANKSLPESIRDAISTMKWKLDDDIPPMHFKSLETMAEIRQKSNQKPANVLEIVELLRSSAATTAAPTGRSKQEEENLEYLARIAAALILLGNGYTDEAHDLVLGMSWRGELPYAYGPPVNIMDETLQTLACYTHCLVHRAEGPHPSEFNMTGFQNSDYWASMTMRSLDGIANLPLSQIQESIVALSSDNNNTSASSFSLEAAKAWVTSKLVIAQPCLWDPRILTELCAEVVATQQQKQQQPHALKDFAEQAAVIELRLILEYALSAMGFGGD